MDENLTPAVALIAHFQGDPSELATRFRAAAIQYADSPDAPQPTTAVLLRNKDGIAVVQLSAAGWCTRRRSDGLSSTSS